MLSAKDKKTEKKISHLLFNRYIYIYRDGDTRYDKFIK